MPDIKNVKKPNQTKKGTISPQPRLPSSHRTFGQKSADWITTICGSWFFITILVIIIIIWAIFNTFGGPYVVDIWPFVFLNLMLSSLAAIEASIILMSQNRQGERDRLRSERDYLIDRKTEREVQLIQQDLAEIKKMLKKLKK